MEKLKESPFNGINMVNQQDIDVMDKWQICPEIDKIKSCIGNGDMWVLLGVFVGVCVVMLSIVGIC